MKEYYKKPVTVEAVQWVGVEIPPELFEWGVDAWVAYGDGSKPMLCLGRYGQPPPHALRGDYIIRDNQGEIYPCDQPTFETTYALIEES